MNIVWIIVYWILITGGAMTLDASKQRTNLYLKQFFRYYWQCFFFFPEVYHNFRDNNLVSLWYYRSWCVYLVPASRHCCLSYGTKQRYFMFCSHVHCLHILSALRKSTLLFSIWHVPVVTFSRPHLNFWNRF